jgi:hypothetical protein
VSPRRARALLSPPAQSRCADSLILPSGPQLTHPRRIAGAFHR